MHRQPLVMVDMKNVNTLKNTLLWISPDIELKLLRDLIYIFQGQSSRNVMFSSHYNLILIVPMLW